METELASRQEIRFMRLPEVLALCGKSRSSIYVAIKKGEFPAPVKLSSRSSAWMRSEIAAWTESRVNASRAEKR